jgi:hypothetical protein
VDAPLQQALRGLLVVFAAALAFFAFVVGSGILGGLGQAILGLAFGTAVLAIVWRRLDAPTRARLRTEVRGYLHRPSSRR